MTKARDLASSTPVPSTVSTTELGYVDGVTSAIQTQVDSKLATATASSTYQTKAATGLVLLNTTSFSGVSSQSFNDVFSATYQNYVVYLNMESTLTSDFQFRWRVSGADNTSSVYNYQIAGLTSSNTSSNLTGATQNLFKFSSGFANNTTATTLNFFDPFTTNRSFFTSASIGVGGGLSITNTGAGQHTNSTSFTGFTLFASTGNITGTVRVYGVTN
jgi:hypothetical protein